MPRVKKEKPMSQSQYLKACDRLIKNRIPKHPRFDEIKCVVGIVDSNGAVDARIIFEDNDDVYHASYFKKPRYKAWRWWSHSGLERSCLCTVSLNTEDCEAVKNWLYKNGCLNDWEIRP